MARFPRPLQFARYSVQAIVVAYVLVLTIANDAGEKWAANLHTICPFGGVVNIYTYVSDGGYVAKLHSAVFVMLLALVIGLVLTGKSFCGWICPLGSVQEALGGIGKRLWPRVYNKVPRWLERILQYLKWLILAWVLVQTARSARLIFQDWDPYYNLFRIWTDEIAISGYVVAGLTLLASLFIPRPFSRYACPLGAFNGLFNSFSVVGIKRDAQTCTDCGRCVKVCPVNINVLASTAVRSVECTRCLKCVDVCPQNSRDHDTLKLHTWFNRWSKRENTETASTAGRRRSVPVSLFASIAVAAFALPILVTNLTGDFQITKHGDFQTPEDIKGSTTLEEIVENYGLTSQELYNGLGLPSDLDASTALKDLSDEMGLEGGEEVISPTVMREVVRYLDQPLAELAQAGVAEDRLAETTALAGLPSTATLRDLLREGPPGSGLYLFTGVGESVPETTVQPPAAEEPSALDESQEIKGKTTLAEIQALGGDFTALLEEFGIPADTPLDSTLRDLADRYGFEMSEFRASLESTTP